MLKTIDPVLTPDLLYVLAAMGHGDDLAIVDGNFPAASVGAKTVRGGAIVLAGVTVPHLVRAVLSVLPVDAYVPDPIRRMEIVGDPATLPPVQQEVASIVEDVCGTDATHPLLVGVERYAFYEAAKQAFAVVQAIDARGYGCFLVRKGVILI